MSTEPEKTTRSTAAADDTRGRPTAAAAEVPWYRQLLAIRNTLIIIITPLFFLPLLVSYPTPVRQQLNILSHRIITLLVCIVDDVQ